MSEFEELLAEQLKDDDFRQEYEALEQEFSELQGLIDKGKPEQI